MAMAQAAIEKLIRYESEEDDDDVTFEYAKLKHATNKAVLVKVEGEETWIPYSHLVEHWPDSSEMRISQWIAEQVGLT
jgi:hypothetical protein